MTPEQRRGIARGAVPLLVISFACAVLITAIHQAAKERIESNRQRMALGAVQEVMPLSHDNDLLTDRIIVTDPGAFGTRDPVSVFRARAKGEPVGVVFMPATAQGYNEAIVLAVGVSHSGELTGVRVNRHAETEGLGDQVDQSKSRWIRQFSGRSLLNTPMAAWAVARDGGEFDQISGATITPRAVINAVRKVLEYYERNRDSLYR